MEAEKRATLEKELSARRQAEIDRVRAETKGKIEHERANHHLHLEKLHAEAEENRTTVLEATKIAAQAIGDGLTNYLNDKEKLHVDCYWFKLSGVGCIYSKSWNYCSR